MSILPCRWPVNATIVLSFLVPLISLSQVTIKEKVEIKPGQPSVTSISDLPPFLKTNIVTLPFGGEVFVKSEFYAPYQAHQFLRMNGQVVLEDLQLAPFLYLGYYPSGAQLSFEIFAVDTLESGEVVVQTISVNAVQPMEYLGPCSNAASFQLGSFGQDGDGNEIFFPSYVFVGVGTSTPGGPPVQLAAWDSHCYFPFSSGVTARLINSCGLWSYVPGIAVKAEIIEGAQWGDLVDASGRGVKTIDSLEQNNGEFIVAFRAWGNEPRQEEHVTIRLTSNDGRFATTANVFVDPYPFPLSVIPGRSEIQPGDTTRIDIQMMNADGTPSGGELVSSTYTIVQGDPGAFLYSPDSTEVGTSITGVFPTAMLYVPSRPDMPESFDIVVRIHAEEPCLDCVEGKIVVDSIPNPPGGVPLIVLRADHGASRPSTLSKIIGQSSGGRSVERRDTIFVVSKRGMEQGSRMNNVESQMLAVSPAANLNNRSSGGPPPSLQDVTSHYGLVRVTVKNQVACAQTTITPSVLAPGDTASLSFKTTDGADFPAGQEFDVFIQEGGDTVGVLLSSTGSGRILTKVQTPVSYVAPSTVNGSMTVHIRAAAYSLVSGSVNMAALPVKGFPSTERALSGFSNQLSGKKLAEARIADLLKFLAESECPLPALVTVVKGKKIPTSISLKVNPEEVIAPGSADLEVTLKAGGIAIETGATDETIDYSLGYEAEKYGQLNQTDPPGIGMTLPNVGYGKSVNISFAKQTFDERFPLKIQVRAGVHGKENLNAGQVFTLVGPHTTGKYFSQSADGWGGDVYDTYKRLTYDKAADSVDVDGNTVFWTIRDKGCALSCMAMVLKAFGCDVDPGKLNDWMNDPKNSAFDEDGNVDWQYALLKYPGSTVGSSLPVNERHAPPAPTAALDYNLSQGYPSIVQFRNPDSGHLHWAVVTGKTLSGQYTILDPGSRSRVLLDPTKIYKYREIIPQ